MIKSQHRNMTAYMVTLALAYVPMQDAITIVKIDKCAEVEILGNTLGYTNCFKSYNTATIWAR